MACVSVLLRRFFSLSLCSRTLRPEDLVKEEISRGKRGTQREQQGSGKRICLGGQARAERWFPGLLQS